MGSLVGWRYSECLKNADRAHSRSNMLHSILSPEKFAVESACAASDHIYIHRELVWPGVTMTLLRTEYCKPCKPEKIAPYMYTQLYNETLSENTPLLAAYAAFRRGAFLRCAAEAGGA